MSEDDRTQGDTTNGRERNTAVDQFGRWCLETGRLLESAENARIEVYIRSLLPPPGAKESQQRVIRDLKRRADGTEIGKVLVDVWGERLCLCAECQRTEVGRVALDRVRTLERWGDEYDASVGAFFERTRTESSVTGGSYDGIVPPRVTATLYVDSRLAGVFPCRFGDERFSVTDFVEAIPRLTQRSDVADPIESSQ